MAVLRQTQNALCEWAVEAGIEPGRHNGPEVLIGVPGRRVGSVPYRTGMPPHAINPANINGIITGWPHVDINSPFHPLGAKIVMHLSGEQTTEELLESRFELASDLTKTIQRSMPRYGDVARSFLVGQNEAELQALRRGVFRYAKVEVAEDPGIAAKTVAELCRDGLTFVLSDFEALPLSEVKPTRRQTKKAIGVKINHEFEVDISRLRGHGFILFDGEDEYRTDKEDEFEALDKVIREHDAVIKDRMVSAGLAVAQVIAKADKEPGEKRGFNMRDADRQIARAIRRKHR